ncbi:hypothetical protein ACJVC5_10075 [Peredibacter sp. HCB2-198]|uniref:hypothetical protein n=1 Tax=Peredibacter sp. HCB2-198 TaxID=3383025 RepID=UPI0038B671A5
MKKLFAVILSLSLIIAPVPVAHAGAGGIAKQILGIANGVVGAAVITKCKLASTQPSILIYMAGSIVFVAAEVAGGKKKTKDVESQAQSLDQLKANMKEGGDYQMAAIEERIKDEKSTLSFIQKRRKWMMATKAIYAAATAMAALEIVMQSPPIFKSWEAACMPDQSHMPMVSAIGLAYGAAMSSGGTLKGFAISAALGFVVKEVLSRVGIGAEIADKAISILSTAPGRIAFFAAATALVMMIDSELAKEESESKKRLADLEKVRDAFKAASQTTTQLAEGSSTDNAAGANANGTDGTDGTDPTKKTYEINKLAQGTEVKKQCFSRGSDGAMSYSENGCKNSIKLVRPKFEANMNLPTLKSVSNLATDMGQAVADGDMGKADLAAGELASMASRMDAVKDSLMKKINDQMKKEGKKPIDVNAELQRQVTALNDAINKQTPGAGNYTVAGLGDMSSASKGSGEASVSPVDTAASDLNGEVAKAAEAPAQEVTPIGSEASALSSITEDSLGVANAEEALGILGAKKAESNEMNFTTAQGDISGESESSIFKQVSNRYFLNYNKFFQRKEINPPMAAPAPAN